MTSNKGAMKKRLMVMAIIALVIMMAIRKISK